ncbi:AMP-dependent synthetase/ligase [Penicillium robsamsonii]|uniref:AMP-dependent synthetase/ligase n=1 Tax=Penicillium robsamsonii TaxID=1792511 RepID=UPI00254720CA|nr:AMP-dependent synthetase/ligase [Penicillium robsamsonii]KAJ5827283.1 AMP-dependent synthetase/ligase [Penicillium robsamsonii]
MGEYIEPSATPWVGEGWRKPHDDGWSDYMALPMLPDIRHDELLALAWILILFRGTVNSEDGGFSYIKKSSIQSSLISDVIEGEGSSLRSALEAIRRWGQFEGELSDTLLCQNACLESKCTFSLEARLSRDVLYIRGTPQSLTATQPVKAVLPHIFADIILSIASDLDQPLVKAIQVGRRELLQLWKWNGPMPPTIDHCIQDIISEKAQGQLDRPAVVSWDGEMTYRQLEERSTNLARHLVDLGLKTGKAVPLCFEKSMWTIVGVLAVMKAGGALVLMDPSQPEGRLSTIASEVEAGFILTSELQGELGSRIVPDGKQVIVSALIDQEAFKSLPVDLPVVPASSTIYIQFTSGSTGKPKGVVISHSNYTSGAVPRAVAVGYKEHSRVLDFPSYAFDVSVDCMLCTLANGGCICVPSEDQRVNDLSGAIREMRVNMAHMTPSVARVLAPDIMPSLEVIGLGGEAISASDAAEWGQKTKIVIAYGPSECTVGCTINNNIPPGQSYTSIGQGVGGTTWVVDPSNHDRLMPIGAVGELLIEGPVVGDGYLNNPEKTAEAFIKDPAWLVEGGGDVLGRKGRLYKTGDLVRYDPDASGSVVFIGRADQQVKLRGQRVELGEIEHHVRNYFPAGASVAAEVIFPGGKKSDATLIVFVAEEKSEKTGTICEIISFSSSFQKLVAGIDDALAKNLPRYMIPTAYIPLNHIPLLVSLKTDRKQLRALGNDLTRRHIAELRLSTVLKLAPRTEMERKLHSLWLKLFGDEAEIGVNDHFFSLGGDSLKAMKLVASAREQLLAVQVTDVFQSPVLEDLALKLKEIDNKAPLDVPAFSLLPVSWEADAARVEVASLCNLNPDEVTDVYPCTPLQEALMALSAKYTDAYVAQRVIELQDVQTARRLQAALERVSAESAILRTRIVQVPRRGLMQVVVQTNTPWLHSSNLTEYLGTDTLKGMSLGTDLARFAIVDDETTSKTSIVLSIHHALYDGWSMPLIVDRVNGAYRGEDIGSPAPFKNFIKWLRDTDQVSTEKYWETQLEGATTLQFPLIPYTGYQARADSLLEHYVKLPRASSSSTTSIATTIRAAWGLLAAHYTSSDDVVFGETMTGRTAPVAAVEEIEGPMITTVPVRVCIDRKARASGYLQQIHDQTVDRIPHEHMGLQHIRRLNADAREACELRTGIVIHPTVEESMSSSKEEPATAFVPTSEAEAAREALKFNSYALMLVFTVDTNGFLIMASFDSKTIDVPQMEQALKQFDRLVQQILEDPTQRIQHIYDSAIERDLTEQYGLAKSGPASLPTEELYSSVTSTWIVNPNEHECLVPSGGLGELLVEKEGGLNSSNLVANPTWFEHPTKLYTTNQLAKYTSDGSVIIIRAKDAQVGQLQPRNKDLHGCQAITTVTQKKLQRVWSQVLDIPCEDILLDDSFFDLGGDSIRAMKLVSEARMDGLHLTVTTIFNHRSLFDMAEHTVEAQPSVVTSQDYAPFSSLDVTDVNAFINKMAPLLAQPEWKIVDAYPSRPLQEIAIHGTVQLPRYSMRYELFYMDTVVDRTKLFQSCQELVSRNEILRTVFMDHEGVSLGVVVDDLPCQIIEYEIESDVKAFSQKLCDVDVQSRVPLGSPFLKFFFVRHVDGRSSLIMRISHAQYDEICLPILLQQLSALYEGRPVPKSLPFSSYVNHVTRTNLPVSIPYWRDLLQGSSMTRIQPDIPVVSAAHFAISKDANIAARPREITVATLPTAAWALCLARRLSLDDVTFGEVVSGRNIDLPNADAIVGPSWQYVPVRVKFADEWSAMDLLRFVQRQHLESARFEGIGLKEIIKDCTDWPETVDWFDSVVHQDVEHVEDLSFMAASSRMQTIYPHFEPLREIKVQAFPKGDTLCIEVVTVQSWSAFAVSLLDEIVDTVEQLTNRVHSRIL